MKTLFLNFKDMYDTYKHCEIFIYKEVDYGTEHIVQPISDDYVFLFNYDIKNEYDIVYFKDKKREVIDWLDKTETCKVGYWWL